MGLDWPRRHLSPHPAGRDPEKPSQGAGVRRRKARPPGPGRAGGEGGTAESSRGGEAVAVQLGR